MKRNKKIEIGIIILFLIATSGIFLISRLYLDYILTDIVIPKKSFYNLLSLSFFQALGLTTILTFFHFLNKKRLKNGKKPI